MCESGNSEYAGPFTFTTECEVSTAPYSHGFEDLSCWTNSDSAPWLLGSGTSYGPGTVTEGTSAVYFNVYNYTSGTVGDLMSPSIDLSALTVPNLTFDYYDSSAFSFDSNTDTVDVLVDIIIALDIIYMLLGVIRMLDMFMSRRNPSI